MSWFETIKKLYPYLREGNLSECIAKVTNIIKSADIPFPFRIVCNLDFSNNPIVISELFDDFIKKESFRISLKAIYTETNGFAINPDLWFFDIFSYDKYGGHGDYDWLAYWNGEYNSSIILTGMEPLQDIYASNAFNDPTYSDLIDHSSLLVVLKFQNLIKRSLFHLQNLKIPVLATSHDYDFIYEYSK